jgi:transcriptional regulator with XRE-family HTH domain
VETADTPHAADDFAQILKRLRDSYSVTETEVARRIGAHVSTVNNWAHRKSTPRPDAIRAIAREFPAFTEAELFAAAGRKAPGPLSKAAEERLLELFRGLTPEQQELKELELRAINDLNRQTQ